MGENIEQWVPVKDYEGLYECSTLARIRSLDVIRNCRHGNGRLVKGKILSPALSGNPAYFALTLTNKQGVRKTIKVHNIIFFSFNPLIEVKQGYEVDHVDNNRFNNLPNNFQYITGRINCLKRTASYEKRKNRLIGCQYNNGSFMARILWEGKYYYLGTTKHEVHAHFKYLIALCRINSGLAPI